MNPAGTVRIRRIEADDWLSFKAVRLAALAESPAAFGSTLEREMAFDDDVWQARAHQAAAGVDRALFLAWSGDDPVGIVGGMREGVGPVELVAMWVAPSARGQGVGQQLVSAVIEFAREAGAPRVELWVVRGNDPAQRLYETMGFVVTGDVQALPSDPCKDEVRMVHPLG